MSLSEDSFRPSRQKFARASSGGQTRDPGTTANLLKQHKTEGTKGKLLGALGVGLSALAAGATGGLATPLVGALASGGAGLAGMGAAGAAGKQDLIRQQLASAPNPNATKDY